MKKQKQKTQKHGSLKQKMFVILLLQAQENISGMRSLFR